jgi:16S rRNA (cytosine1402-N4)-methyltransferase
MQQQEHHQPVFLDEVIRYLAINPQGIYVDATFGRGGHSRAILQKLGSPGRLLVIDKDPAAVASAQQLAAQDPRIEVHDGSFTCLATVIKEKGIEGKINGILFDLGVSSPQLDQAERGFSFLREGPLDMRMDPRVGISAAEWIQTVREEEMRRVFKEYGEERYAKRIARAIAHLRNETSITTTKQLADIVSEAHPHWEKHKHPATRVFQAIRIWINNEFGELTMALKQSLEGLAVGGRLVVISFHSLEDRIVKQFMREQAREPQALKYLPMAMPESFQPRLKVLTRGIKADVQKTNENPRCRSAVLRVAEKIR